MILPHSQTKLREVYTESSMLALDVVQYDKSFGVSVVKLVHLAVDLK